MADRWGPSAVAWQIAVDILTKAAWPRPLTSISFVPDDGLWSLWAEIQSANGDRHTLHQSIVQTEEGLIYAAEQIAGRMSQWK